MFGLPLFCVFVFVFAAGAVLCVARCGGIGAECLFVFFFRAGDLISAAHDGGFCCLTASKKCERRSICVAFFKNSVSNDLHDEVEYTRSPQHAIARRRCGCSGALRFEDLLSRTPGDVADGFARGKGVAVAWVVAAAPKHRESTVLRRLRFFPSFLILAPLPDEWTFSAVQIIFCLNTLF